MPSTINSPSPLIANRLRQSAKRGLQVNVVNPVDDDWLMKIANKAIVAPNQMVGTLAQILKAVAEAKQVAVPTVAANVSVSDSARTRGRSGPCRACLDAVSVAGSARRTSATAGDARSGS